MNGAPTFVPAGEFSATLRVAVPPLGISSTSVTVTVTVKSVVRLPSLAVTVTL